MIKRQDALDRLSTWALCAALAIAALLGPVLIVAADTSDSLVIALFCTVALTVPCSWALYLLWRDRPFREGD